MQLPKSPPSHQLSEYSLGVLRASVPAHLFISRQETGGDYGADLVLELLKDGHATNWRIYTQLKASTRRSPTEGGYAFAVPLSTLAYLSTQPSIFVVFSAEDHTLWWEYCDTLRRYAKHTGKWEQKSFVYRFSKRLTDEAWQDIHGTFLRMYDLARVVATHSDGPLISLGRHQHDDAAVVLRLVRDPSPPWFFAQSFLGVGIVLPREGQPYWWPRLPNEEWLASLRAIEREVGSLDAPELFGDYGDVLRDYEDVAMRWYRDAYRRARDLLGLSLFPIGMLPQTSDKPAPGLTREFFATICACVAGKFSDQLPGGPTPSGDVAYQVATPFVRVEVPTRSGPYVPAWTFLPEDLQRHIIFDPPMDWSTHLPIVAAFESTEEAHAIVAAHRQVTEQMLSSPLTPELFMRYLAADAMCQRRRARVSRACGL